MGLFDAAECPVTFGSDRRRVQVIARRTTSCRNFRNECRRGHVLNLVVALVNPLERC